jgi:nucleoside phosphorylase
MKILIVCPIPVEYAACRESLVLRDQPSLAGCRSSHGTIGACELQAVESGPAKARAAAATASGLEHFEPDLVLDTGSCAGVEPGTVIGEIVLCRECFEADISGSGFPRNSIPEMRLPSALGFLPQEAREDLLRKAVEQGQLLGRRVRPGNQVCGEFLIHSPEMRGELYRLFQASAGNWETAGVFVPALKNAVPALSFRVITDLGDAQALSDFRRNVKTRTRELYRYLGALMEYGWFELFREHWARLDRVVQQGLPGMVLP